MNWCLEIQSFILFTSTFHGIHSLVLTEYKLNQATILHDYVTWSTYLILHLYVMENDESKEKLFERKVSDMHRNKFHIGMQTTAGRNA